MVNGVLPLPMFALIVSAFAGVLPLVVTITSKNPAVVATPVAAATPVPLARLNCVALMIDATVAPAGMFALPVIGMPT